MIETPFRFEAILPPEKLQRIALLSLRWSLIEHIIGNCLRVMLNLSEKEAETRVFKLSLHNRMEEMKELAKQRPLNPKAKAAFDELMPIMSGIKELRNHVAHAIIVDDKLHSRREQSSYGLDQIISAEDLTKYAGHLVIALRDALGSKDYPPGTEPGPLPERPDIPSSLVDLFSSPNE